MPKGGDERAQVCGWLKDKFGVSWQIVPVSLTEMISGSDPAAAQRVLQAVYRMRKLDISILQQPYDQD